MTACQSSPLSDGLSALLSPQVNADLACGVWTVPADRAGSTDHTNPSSLAERRLSVQPLRLLPSFLRKRSISSLAFENAHDEERLLSWSPSHFRSIKRMKEPSGSTLPFSDTTSVSTPASSRSVLRPTVTSGETAARLACLISTDHIPTSGGSKALLSPIRFAVQVGREEEWPTVSEQSHVLTSKSTTLFQTQSKYLYYPPRNPLDSIGNVSDLDRKVPRRRLSYGEPLTTTEPRPLHKATGSRELRRRAGWETDDDDYGSCIEETLKASAIRPYYSEPARSKPRLVLDLTEGETIEEARATTVISSPSKPKVISITSRRGPVTPTTKISPLSQAQKDQHSYPDTPPDTPADAAGLGINSTEETRHDLVFDKIKAIPTWDPRLRSLETSTPCSTDTVRQISSTIIPKDRPDTPRPLQTPAPQLSELTTWILTELEQSVTGNPANSLRLDSPVIQQIRLPAAQRRVPRFQPPPLPLSRYSSFEPLSSHPPTCTPSPSLQMTTVSSLNPPSTTTLTALHSIFPHASPSLLSSLQACCLALHHISNIHLPSSPSPLPSVLIPPSRCNTATYSPLLSPEMSYIPSKARAMLGLQPSTPSRPLLPTSWLHPQSVTWRERIENLEVGLGKEVATLLQGCCGGGAETDGEPLMRAVGEVVRMGEALRV